MNTLHPRTAQPLARAVAVLTATALLLLASLALGTSDRAHAADPARWDAGYIISDAAFYASGSLTAAQIQTFIDTRGATCRPGPDGTPCLKDYRQDTTSRAATAMCPGTYTGAARESAAQIIAKVAAACGMSPKVLLVMLQKEQGLLTASGASLVPSRYRNAMGFACPDTAPCNPAFAGFANQVYSAASRLREYALYPTRFNHQARTVENVRFHPNTACGSSPVYLQNQATASLYNYTPYQPNAAALAAGLGTGDACSAYGNRNFFHYYTAWFGAPNARSPIGVVDSVVGINTGVTVTGWALDQDTVASTQVHVYVDGVGHATLANLPRPDVGAAHGAGDRHGFAATFPAAPGPHTVCAYAINIGQGSNTAIGCRRVTVPDRAPIGALDAVTSVGPDVTVTGWSLDPDTTASNAVHIYVDGAPRAAVPADRSRPDVAAAFGRGDRHGYGWTGTMTGGDHRVCAYGINTVAGPNTLLGCRTVTVDPDRRPIGRVDGVSTSGSQLTVRGWALDPDTSASTTVHVYVDGVGVAVAADQSRPDIAAAFGLGDRHGFTHTRTLAPGSHQVCTYAINTAPRPNTTLGCTTVVTA